MENAKKVFISYAIDTTKDSNRILNLSNILRAQGIDSIIDQYEDFPSEGWPRWMENQIDTSDYVLIIINKTYTEKFNKSVLGKGVTWEIDIIYQHLYDSNGVNKKFIPVIFDKTDLSYVPKPLNKYTHYDVSSPEEIKKLQNMIKGIPNTIKPPLGFTQPLPVKPRKSISMSSIPFFDREDEKNDFKKALDDNSTLIVYAGSDRGISYFVNNIKKDLGLTIVAQRRDDCDESLRRIFVETIIYEYSGKDNLKEYEKKLLLNLKNCYPREDRESKDYEKLCGLCNGFTESNIVAQAKDVKESFHTFFEESLIAEASAGDCAHSVILIIDTADKMAEEDRTFLLSMISSSAVKPVLIFRDITKKHKCSHTQKEVLFSAPDEKFIREVFGENTDPNEVKKLAEEGNIRVIFEKFRIVGGSELSTLESCINYISYACDKIHARDLDKLIEKIAKERKTLYIPQDITIESAIKSALVALSLRGYVEKNNEYIVHKNKGYPDSFGDESFLYKNIVAEYFANEYRRKKKDIYVLELLRKLSVDSDVRELLKGKEVYAVDIARSMLKYKLSTGEDIKEELHESCKLEMPADTELMLLSLCRQYKHNEALNAMNSWQSEIKNGCEYRRLYATLLNRSYLHQEAESQLKKVYDEEKDQSQKNLLASYIIVNYIHLEELKKAVDFYQDHIKENTEKNNLGYVHKSMASAIIKPIEREKYLIKAVNLFESEETKDEFGEYSSKSDLGYALTISGDKHIERGRNLLECARKGLGKIGERDRFIVLNNLGINLLYSGLSDSDVPCNELFKKVKVIGKTTMQNLFATINLAYYYMTNEEGKDFSEAKKLLDAIEEKVEKSINRVKQQYYPARAFLAYCTEDKTELELQIKKCECFPNRYEQERLNKILEIYHSYINGDNSKKYDGKSWRDFYIPCGLFYWYVDPLKFLSEETINRIIS